MKKIPTIWLRDDTRRYVTEEPNPECLWVFEGEGTATRKYDGTCTMFDGERWWARREVKMDKRCPAGFVEVDHDTVTGKSVGWEPMDQSAFFKWHREALAYEPAHGWYVGTYELIGPKVNGNPEREDRHLLVQHDGAELVPLDSRSFEVIRDVVLRLKGDAGVEGIVFHHPDGRMAKIKARDFAAFS